MIIKLAETLSSFCEETVDELDIRECSNVQLNILIQKKLLLGNIKTIPSIATEKLNFTARFLFKEVNLRDIEKEILNVKTGKVVVSIATQLKYLNKC